jgi:hypothetical protein
MEVAMAKGQMRSNKEAKKPKKSATAKAKPGAASTFVQPEISRKSAKKP